MSRKEVRSEVASIEDCVDAKIQKLEENKERAKKDELHQLVTAI